MEHGNRSERLTRGAEHVEPRSELVDRLREGAPLRVKLGLDPTARDVTLGWAVPLRKLREFQDHGHTAVLIVGDFTARIGDPSGKSETRRRLTEDEVKGYAERVLDQFMDILSPDNLEIRYNSEWLTPLDLGAILELTSNYTVAQMLERDDFSKRYAERRPISLIEFMYPLAQAYDSVAVRADVELGGTDQLFNLLVGRDIQRAYGLRPQVALTMPLLEGLDGVQKMSQSLGNYIGIREEPDEMFGKLMSVPDRVVVRYATLAAWMDDDAVREIDAGVRAGGPEAGRAKRAMARAVVELFHGPEAAAGAEGSFDRRFVRGEIPDEIPEAHIPGHAIDGDRVFLPTVLVETGLAGSGSEARRLLAGGGVKLGGEPTAAEWQRIEDLVGTVLQVGKRRFVRLREG